MAKAESERLRPVLDMALRKEQEAAQALGYLNQKITQEHQTLQQLKEYEQDYHQNVIAKRMQGDQVFNRYSLLRYQNFISRLNEAVGQQEAQIDQVEGQLQQVREYWMKSRARVQAIESVMRKAQEREQVAAAKREQKMVDELVCIAAARRMLARLDAN